MQALRPQSNMGNTSQDLTDIEVGKCTEASLSKALDSHMKSSLLKTLGLHMEAILPNAPQLREEDNPLHITNLLPFVIPTKKCLRQELIRLRPLLHLTTPHH